MIGLPGPALQRRWGSGPATPHPVLDRAVAVWPAEVARRAAEGLRLLLAERIAADPTGAWGSSRLTGDGFPVEFNLVSSDDRLRCTVEPGGPRLAPRERLTLAARSVAAVGGVAVPADLLAACRRLQDDDARYGAWIGCRHGPAGSTYKLYAEVSASVGRVATARPGTPRTRAGIAEPRGPGTRPGLAAPQASAIRGGNAVPAASPFGIGAPRLPDRTARLRMVACTPATGETEAYYRVPDLGPEHIPRVLAAAGLESRAAELLDFLARAYGHPFTGRLPGHSVGISYAATADGEPLAVTLFFFACVFWGSDARIRRSLQRLASELGGDDSRYRALTSEPAATPGPACAADSTTAPRTVTAAGPRTRHGLLGVTIAGAARPVLSIGVRP